MTESKTIKKVKKRRKVKQLICKYLGLPLDPVPYGSLIIRFEFAEEAVLVVDAGGRKGSVSSFSSPLIFGLFFLMLIQVCDAHNTKMVKQSPAETAEISIKAIPSRISLHDAESVSMKSV